MLTKEELNAIGERCEKATPNPELTRYDHGGGRSFLQTGDWESLHGKRDRKLVADYYNEEDREFYHACRTDIPALLAHIEELEKQIIKWVPVSERSPDITSWRITNGPSETAL